MQLSAARLGKYHFLLFTHDCTLAMLTAIIFYYSWAGTAKVPHFMLSFLFLAVLPCLLALLAVMLLLQLILVSAESLMPVLASIPKLTLVVLLTPCDAALLALLDSLPELLTLFASLIVAS